MKALDLLEPFDCHKFDGGKDPHDERVSGVRQIKAARLVDSGSGARSLVAVH